MDQQEEFSKPVEDTTSDTNIDDGEDFDYLEGMALKPGQYFHPLCADLPLSRNDKLFLRLGLNEMLRHDLNLNVLLGVLITITFIPLPMEKPMGVRIF